MLLLIYDPFDGSLNGWVGGVGRWKYSEFLSELRKNCESRGIEREAVKWMQIREESFVEGRRTKEEAVKTTTTKKLPQIQFGNKLMH